MRGFGQPGGEPIPNVMGFQPNTWIQANQVIPPSPQAASLGRYGNIPVNYYTGSPNIDIPLHTTAGKYLQMPMSLAYDANSVKPGSLPSWTGTGWTLQAGGVISRSVVGNPDIARNYYHWNWDPPGSAFSPDLLTSPSPDSILEYEFKEQVAAGNIETQPDVYYFNLPGYSGSFIITRDWQVIFRDYTDWSIQVFHTAIAFPADPSLSLGEENLYDIIGFTLTDPSGVSYQFGQNYNDYNELNFHYNREYTAFVNEIIIPVNPPPSQTQYRFNSAWYLRRIVSADGSEVLELENEAIRNITGIPQNVMVDPFTPPFNVYSDDAMTFPAELYPESTCCPGIYGQSAGDGLGGGNHRIYNRQYLKSATLSIGGEPAERVLFNAGYASSGASGTYGPRTSDIQLNTLTVQRRWQGALENAIDFSFGYDLSTGRLTLKSVQERSASGAEQKPPYLFSYHAGSLPSTNNSDANAIDYWGYYNGQHSNTNTLVPQVTINDKTYNWGGANRRAYLQLAGVLKTIQYPTGGRTELNYEGHTIAADLPNIGTQIGGFRIRSIADYPGGSASPVTRTFGYVLPEGTSSGLLLQRMRVYEYSTYKNFNNIDIGCLDSPLLVHSADPCVCSEYLCTSITIFASGTGPFSFVQGNHIGYSRVEEIIGDPSGNIGKSVYWFENAPVGDVLWDTRNGKMLKMEVRDADDEVIKEMEYGYTYSTTSCPGSGCPQIVPFRVLSPLNQDNKIRLCQRASDGQYEWTIRSGTTSSYPACTRAEVFRVKLFRAGYIAGTTWSRLDFVKTTDHFYAPGSPGTVQKNVSYTYGNNNIAMPTAIQFNNSDGTAFRTDVSYYSRPGIKAIPGRVIKRVGGTIAAGTDQDLDGSGRPLAIYEILDHENNRLLRVSIPGYNAAGRPTGVTFMGELPETFTWQNGLLTKRVKGQWEWNYNYNNLRLPISFTDIDGQAVHYEYDGLLRLKRSRARNNNIITDLAYNYGSPNSIVSTTTYSDAPTQTLTEEFDGLGRPMRSIHNGVVKKEQFYDAYGRIWKETYLPGNFITYDFDNSPLNRVLKQTFPDGHFTRTLYGADGSYYKTTAIDEKGNESSVLTEIVERTFRTIDALGGVTTFTYAPHGEPLRVQPPSGGPYLYDYDNRRRLTYKKVPGARAQIFRYYDENNLLKYSIDGKGQRIDHYYDDYLREVRATLAQVPNWDPEAPLAPHGAPGSDMLITRYGEEFPALPQIYRGRVRETRAALFSNTLPVPDFVESLFTYDNFGRATDRTETLPQGGSQAWNLGFDHADRLLFETRTISSSLGNLTSTTSHGYDNFGRQIYYAASAGAPFAAAVAMTWNDRDQMTSKKLGYAGNRQLDLINYRYNERGWLTHINDIVHERWETPYDICQGPADNEHLLQQEEKATLADLLELLCRGEDVAINDLDPCAQGGCVEELADFFLDIEQEIELKGDEQSVSLRLHGIYYRHTLIELPGAPYLWEHGPSGMIHDAGPALKADLGAWLHNKGFRFDSITVSLTPPQWSKKVSVMRLSLRIWQSNLPFDYVIYSFQNQVPHQRIHFRKLGVRLAPCLDIPTTELAPQIPARAQTPAGLGYPAALYLVRRANGTKEWLFDQEINLAGADYERLLRIPVMNAQEQFDITLGGGQTAVWTLAQLLSQRQQNGLAGVEKIERRIEESPSNPCTLPHLECSPVQREKQAATLAEIRNRMCSLDPQSLTFPVTLYLVQLCNGNTAYILGQENLQYLHGPHVVLDQLVITGPEQLFNIVITRRRPLFAMRFHYEPNGNIKTMKWKVTDYDVKYYLNDYDPLNRLLGSGYGVERIVDTGAGAAFVEQLDTQEYNEFGIEYDAIGNIEKLKRRGLIPSGNCFDPGLIDDLSYHYGTEGRLSGVTDAAPEPFRPHGFKPGAGGNTHYQYDANGNLTQDAHKGIGIAYNFLNLPMQITTPQGNIHFVYDATGRKWAKSAYATAPADENGPEGLRWYVDNAEFLDGKIQHVAFADGRFVAEYDENGAFQGTYRAEYFRTDHLGNTRLTFSDFNHDMVISPRISSGTPTAYDSEITSENHYYPFGLGHTGPWYASVTPENKYLFNGIERVKDFALNWDMAEFRSYDPAVGRWWQVDPLGFISPGYTSFRFGFNNPHSFRDPSGLWERTSNGWQTSDKQEIEEFLRSLKMALGTGGEVNYSDVDSEGVAFTMWSIGEQGNYHGTLHQNSSSSNDAFSFSFQSGSSTDRGEESMIKTRPYARSFSVGWAFGGGFGFEIGRVKDEVGQLAWYFRSDARIGFSAGISYNSTEIIASPGNTFTVGQWEGYDNYTEFALGPIGYGWGENQQYWGKAGDPLLTPGAIAGDLYKIRNIPINDPRDLKGIKPNPSKWMQGIFKGAKVSAYRSWGQTWIK